MCWVTAARRKGLAPGPAPNKKRQRHVWAKSMLFHLNNKGQIFPRMVIVAANTLEFSVNGFHREGWVVPWFPVVSLHSSPDLFLGHFLPYKTVLSTFLMSVESSGAIFLPSLTIRATVWENPSIKVPPGRSGECCAAADSGASLALVQLVPYLQCALGGHNVTVVEMCFFIAQTFHYI